MFTFIKNLFKNSSKKPNIKITASVILNNEVSPAQEILKEATVLKKAKKYNEACNKLKEAFEAEGSGGLTIKDRMRLPMYLQLAKKSDEGWRVLNELNSTYTDVFSQAEIANQKRIFLEKEKKYQQALLFIIWSICKEIERDRSNIQRTIHFSNQMSEGDQEYGYLFHKSNEKVYGKTPNGNPIIDSSYHMFVNRVNYNMSKKGISRRMQSLLNKLNKSELLDPIAENISEYMHLEEQYKLQTIKDILSEMLSNKETTARDNRKILSAYY